MIPAPLRDLSLWLILVLCLSVFCGCTARRQNAADAVAGIHALQTISDPASAAVAQTVAIAASQHAAAAAGTTVAKLPAPTMTPAAIVADPQKYQHQAQAATESVGFWLAVGGGILTGLVTLAAVVRQTGIGGPLVTLAAAVLENAGQRFKRKETEQLAAAMVNVVGVVEDTDNKAVKGLVKNVVTTDQNLSILRAVTAWQKPVDKAL